MKELELESYLSLCPVCNGTGNNPSNKKYKCVCCDGCRVVSHFSISYDVNVPYRSEDDMANNERMILHHMGEIKKILGVNIKEKF